MHESTIDGDGDSKDHALFSVSGMNLPGLVFQSFGEVDSFVQFAQNPIVYVHVAPPGPFKRRWFQSSELGPVTVIKISETCWRAVLCPFTIDKFDQCLAQAHRRYAIVAINNDESLRPLSAAIRETIKKHETPVVFLNKPANGARRT